MKKEELLFQSMSKFMCGHKYTGDKSHFGWTYFKGDKFKEVYCPEELGQKVEIKPE